MHCTGRTLISPWMTTTCSDPERSFLEEAMLAHNPTGPPLAPSPSSPGLRPPAGPGPPIHRVAVWTGHRPWLVLVAVAAVLAWIVGSGLVYRWRHQRLLHGAQQITITTP